MEDKNERSRPIQKLFWITEEEQVKIKRQMVKAKIKNFSNFARLMLTNGQVTVVNFDELLDVKKEVNKIGVNINQIAKAVNTGDEVTLDLLEKLLSQVDHIDTLILDVMRELEKEKMPDGGDQSFPNQTSG
ncbi:plasmid mobilization protein [Streptococcus agalactiae]|uniref:plasmid mobilization protein n=1 Tax=Streptococcus agalactiae TaxID=1311 RepID=UPI00130338BF|nr:plasmid mobilization relaxosome protein MobC [Streptococcus agalactiae]KAF0052066.1 plasmid mobilization relaxosome protein MobC [Streptococcus agalactiae]